MKKFTLKIPQTECNLDKTINYTIYILSTHVKLVSIRLIISNILTCKGMSSALKVTKLSLVSPASNSFNPVKESSGENDA